jgi:hypothetical protein
MLLLFPFNGMIQILVLIGCIVYHLLCLFDTFACLSTARDLQFGSREYEHLQCGNDTNLIKSMKGGLCF